MAVVIFSASDAPKNWLDRVKAWRVQRKYKQLEYFARIWPIVKKSIGITLIPTTISVGVIAWLLYHYDVNYRSIWYGYVGMAMVIVLPFAYALANTLSGIFAWREARSLSGGLMKKLIHMGKAVFLSAVLTYWFAVAVATVYLMLFFYSAFGVMLFRSLAS